MGIRVKTGKIAGICLTQISNCDFEKQKEYINILNQSPWIRVLMAYSGKDFLVEEEKAHEVVRTLTDLKELV